MLKIVDKVYLSTKEASRRYGFSVKWFEMKRWKRLEPKAVKVAGKGRVYYPLEETDNWFRQALQF